MRFASPSRNFAISASAGRFVCHSSGGVAGSAILVSESHAMSATFVRASAVSAGISVSGAGGSAGSPTAGAPAAGFGAAANGSDSAGFEHAVSHTETAATAAQPS